MINFSPVLKRFVDKARLPVMMRALLQRELDSVQLDRSFETVAQQQYTRKLLFSTLFELMMQVVLRQSGSIRAAWLETECDVVVSLASVYNKLNGLEPSTSAALVSFAADRAREVMDEMAGSHVEVLAGLSVRVLDGNCLNGRQHRLQVTRASTAAPLPGKALVVFDPQRETIEAMVPCEDGHAQKRSLLGPLVGAGQMWLADRNFCTEGFLGELADRGAYSLIREHDGLRFTPLEAMRGQVRLDGADSVVSEQWVHPDGREGIKLRRIRVELDAPTRHGESELYLLSTVPESVADAPTLARLYRQGWTIERAFLHLTVQLRCEVNTLSYPPAALFALACAMVVFNVLAVVKAELRMAPRSRRGCRVMRWARTCDRWRRAWTTSSSPRTGRYSTRSARRRWRSGCSSRPRWCRWPDMPRRPRARQHPSPQPSGRTILKSPMCRWPSCW